jgi:hypothetical protein
MKFYFFILCLVSIPGQKALAQTNMDTADHKQQEKGNNYPDFDQALLLESKSDTTANVSFGDLDGDGHLDILLVKGRHWPIIDRVLLGDGSGGIRRSYSLGKIADRSYTGGLSDFNGDGFPDIAISNDAPDRKLIYLNDGKGNFSIGSEFGRPEWPTRNLSIADINKDGLPDLILANRGNASTSNYICLNQGNGKFDSSRIAFARYPATTITPADFNKDGFVDLVVPHRDGGQSYLYPGSPDMAFSDTHRIPFGPADAAIRAAAVADFNGDGLPDIVTIDEFKGVSLYFGQKSNNFSAGIPLADSNSTPYALTIADMDRDGKIDIIVGHKEARSIVFFNDGTGIHFKAIPFGDSKGTVYGFAVADFNEDGIPDIAAARSEATSVLYFGNVRSKSK